MLAAKQIQGLRIPLDLRTALAYLDLEGEFVIRIEGLPMDCGLTAGSQDQAMNWLIGRGEIDGLEILLPRSFNDQVPVGVSIVSSEAGPGGVPQVLSRFDVMLTAEGARSAKAVSALAKKKKVDMPVSDAVNAVLEGHLKPAQAVERLLSRDPKRESA